jgi:hypothetical protein
MFDSRLTLSTPSIFHGNAQLQAVTSFDAIARPGTATCPFTVDLAVSSLTGIQPLLIRSAIHAMTLQAPLAEIYLANHTCHLANGHLLISMPYSPGD